MSATLDVTVIMHRMREQIRERTGLPPRNPESAISGDTSAELEEALRALRLRLAVVGQTPVQPPTARGLVGAILIRAVARSLFWFIPSVKHCLEGFVDALEREAAALKALAESNAENRRILEGIHAEISALSARIGAGGSRNPDGER